MLDHILRCVFRIRLDKVLLLRANVADGLAARRRQVRVFSRLQVKRGEICIRARQPVTPRLSFLLVGLLCDLGASRRRLGLLFLGLITHGLGVALRLSGGLMGGTRTESQANRQDQKEDGEAGADDRQNFHAAVGP